MNHDHDVEAHDDPRDAQQQEGMESVQGIDKADEPELADTEALSSGYEPNDYEKQIVRELHETQVWSGELPHPDAFAAYPEYAQHAMVEWNNARVMDESKRRDKIVDHIIYTERKGVNYNFILNLAFSTFSFVSFILTRDPASFGFMAVPAVSVVFNIYKERKSSKDDSE